MRRIVQSVLGAPPQPQSTSHAGLWLDKYLSGWEPTAKGQLVKQVGNFRDFELYAAFFGRWQAAVTAVTSAFEDNRVVTGRAEALGRLAIHLGAESLIETSIALHRAYGVPYIPGSALKGLTAHFARNHLEGADWKKDGGAYAALFGDQLNAGCVTFFDALWEPNRDLRPLWPDVITVHHPAYYRGEDAPPADWDSPNPIHFLTARGTFWVALSGPSSWAEKAFEILTLALKEEGVGAKTSSGYGRMKLIK